MRPSETAAQQPRRLWTLFTGQRASGAIPCGAIPFMVATRRLLCQRRKRWQFVHVASIVLNDNGRLEIRRDLLEASTQFPREQTGLYASSLVPIPPRLLYQRRNIRGSQLKIGDLSNYRGKRILVMTGTADADHPRKLDEGIVTWLNEHGAKADFIYLGDRGITGNGHMMMLENNSTALAHQIMAWIEGV